MGAYALRFREVAPGPFIPIGFAFKLSSEAYCEEQAAHYAVAARLIRNTEAIDGFRSISWAYKFGDGDQQRFEELQIYGNSSAVMIGTHSQNTMLSGFFVNPQHVANID